MLCHCIGCSDVSQAGIMRSDVHGCFDEFFVGGASLYKGELISFCGQKVKVILGI